MEQEKKKLQEDQYLLFCLDVRTPRVHYIILHKPRFLLAHLIELLVVGFS